MAFLRGVKKYSKPHRIKKEVIKEELQVFNSNERLKDDKQRWKEHLQRMSDSSLAKQIWKYKSIGHRREGRPRNRGTLVVSWCEDDDYDF